MSKPLEKVKAVELRREGFSYREILRQVPVAKSTLSLWLRTVGLSRPQRQRLTEKRLAAARRGWEQLRRERVERVAQAMIKAEAEGHERIAASDSLWLIGTALYWAEGAKLKAWRPSVHVMFTNMDARMILLIRQWLCLCCGIDKEDIVYAVQIHERADIQSALRYWASTLTVPQAQLRVYLKRHNPSTQRKHVGADYYGTIRLFVRRSTMLNHRLAGWVHVLSNHCGVG